MQDTVGEIPRIEQEIGFCNIEPYFTGIIVKHSENIVDILEIGDIIEYKILNVSLETKGYLQGMIDIDDNEMLRNIKNDENYKILSILTKEQYKQNCFKLKENDK